MSSPLWAHLVTCLHPRDSAVPVPLALTENLPFTFPGHLICRHFASAHEPRTPAGLVQSRFGCSREAIGRARGGSYRQGVGAGCSHFHPEGGVLEGGRLAKGSFTPLLLEPGGQWPKVSCSAKKGQGQRGDKKGKGAGLSVLLH